MLPFSEAHPLGQDDAACVVTAGWDQSETQQIATAPADHDQPAHCVVCHLTRAMSGAVSADVTTLGAPVAAVVRHQSLDDSAPTVAFAPPASRGPPATL